MCDNSNPRSGTTTIPTITDVLQSKDKEVIQDVVDDEVLDHEYVMLAKKNYADKYNTSKLLESFNALFSDLNPGEIHGDGKIHQLIDISLRLRAKAEVEHTRLASLTNFIFERYQIIEWTDEDINSFKNNVLYSLNNILNAQKYEIKITNGSGCYSHFQLYLICTLFQMPHESKRRQIIKILYDAYKDKETEFKALESHYKTTVSIARSTLKGMLVFFKDILLPTPSNATSFVEESNKLIQSLSIFFQSANHLV